MEGVPIKILGRAPCKRSTSRKYVTNYFKMQVPKIPKKKFQRKHLPLHF